MGIAYCYSYYIFDILETIMKKNYIIMLALLFLFVIPVSFADSIEQTADADDSSLDLDIEMSSVETNHDDSDNVSLTSEFYDLNDESIDGPDLDTSFSNFNPRFTEKNTFYVNASYDGDVEKGTVANPFKNVNTAFSELQWNRSISNIYIADGVYSIGNTISLSKHLNIIGQSSSNTIINGNNASQMFFLRPNDITFTLCNLTLAGGNSYWGGVIYNNQSTVNLINTIFKDNSAPGYNYSLKSYSGAGGALYNEAGLVRIYNSTFINNQALSSLNVYGGAIYNEFGTIDIYNSRFINNSLRNASYGAGGAIYNYNGYLTIMNTIFANNTIYSNYSLGGAICNYQANNVYLINSLLDGNKIYGNYTLGSAISSKAIFLHVENSTIKNNLAGGNSFDNNTIYNFNGRLQLANVSMENNTIRNPKKNVLLCLEDQIIVSKVFDGELLNNLPSQYDLRTEGSVTSVKSQGSSGACWAFSILAALESYLLKNENETYDLSENNLKNVMGMYGVNGTDWADGGNYQMALAYLLSWQGPVSESEDTFSSYSIIPNYECTVLNHVQDVVYLPMRMGYWDIDQIKCAIMKYGALYVSIYGTSMDKLIYNSVARMPNHAVAIVGWNDDYPANRFPGEKPPGNGAFIIKNSWGINYGERGYGYVSYYDKTFAGLSFDSLSAMAFANVEEIYNYQDIYQYDMIGNTYESLGYNSNTAWLANQFTAKSNNPLSAFGLYTYGSSKYLVNVYVNGGLKFTQEGNVGYAGYHTIKLNQLVDLQKGDSFRVEVKLTTPDSLFPIAIESVRNGYSSKATADLNQSFVSPDGINWYDIAQDTNLVKIADCLYDKVLENANVCLKAYTANVGDLSVDINKNCSYFYKNDLINIIVNLTNNGDYVKDINISVILDEICSIVSLNVVGGVFNESNNLWTIDSLAHAKSAILNLTLNMVENKDLVENSIDINYFDCKINGKEALFNLSFAGFTNLIVKNVTTFAKSSESFNITVTDMLGNPVDGQVLINNDTFKCVNGSVFFTIDLIGGNYTYSVLFEGGSLFKSTTCEFNVEVIKRDVVILANNITTLAKSDDAINITLIDIFGNPVSGKVIINNDTLDCTNGSVILTLNLIGGNYLYDVSFLEDGIFKPASAQFNVKVNKKSTIVSCSNMVTSAIIVNVDGKTGKYFKFTLKDKLGKAIKNKKVSVRFNGKTHTLTTNKYGVASLQINVAKAGKYSISYKFKGDGEYTAVSKSAYVTVNKKKLNLNVAKKTYKASSKIKKLSATLKNAKGKAIAGKKITFSVCGKKYIAKTNSKGTATVNVKLTAKKSYKVITTFLGDGSYLKSVKTSSVVIK